MNKKFKRIFSALLGLILCFSLSISAFAAEPTAHEASTDKKVIGQYTFEVSGDGTVTPRSSLSGYAQKTVTAGNNGILIDCDGQGIGGMGITIDTSCSNGNYRMYYQGASNIGSASNISGYIYSNDHVVLNNSTGYNLWHSNLGQYFIAFDIPSGVSMLVQVWIYG